MSASTFQDRWPDNVAGRYYVSSACLDCAQCTDIAPDIFARYVDGYAYVKRQPSTEDEERRAQEAKLYCPLEAINDDGHQFDSAKIPATAFVTGGSRDPKRKT